jgi:hypothetical protein
MNNFFKMLKMIRPHCFVSMFGGMVQVLSESYDEDEFSPVASQPVLGILRLPRLCAFHPLVYSPD